MAESINIMEGTMSIARADTVMIIEATFLRFPIRDANFSKKGKIAIAIITPHSTGIING